ncbi:MAG TPA: hypothetical protein VIB99_05305 [Candidatus Limnocylindrales bacterium]|jgi:hypothetical protein
MDIKDTARDLKTGTKEAVREGDGHTFADDLGNAGDRMKDDLGKAGDTFREGADDLDRDARTGANQPR